MSLLVAAFLGVAGCGTSHPQVRPSLSADQKLERAEQILISACMSAHGFRYWVPPPAPVPAPDPARRFPHVIDDVAWARANGYGRTAEMSGDEHARLVRNDPNLRYARSLSPGRRGAYELTLRGPPPSAGGSITVRTPRGYTLRTSGKGCIAAAGARLYGDFATWDRAQVIVDNLWPEISAEVRADRAYGAATGRWAGCMRRAGHAYANPDRLRDDLDRTAAGADPAAAHRAEITLAVAEATCARSSGLGPISRRLDAKYTAEVEARFRGTIDTFRRLRADALRRADALVGP
ncbi:MAG TPA: hypothetical protein VF069_13050 [Streptosporangiaceae bacterium]